MGRKNTRKLNVGARLVLNRMREVGKKERGALEAGLHPDNPAACEYKGPKDSSALKISLCKCKPRREPAPDQAGRSW